MLSRTVDNNTPVYSTHEYLPSREARGEHIDLRWSLREIDTEVLKGSKPRTEWGWTSLNVSHGGKQPRDLIAKKSKKMHAYRLNMYASGELIAKCPLLR